MYIRGTYLLRSSMPSATHVDQRRNDLVPPRGCRGVERRALRADKAGVRPRVKEDARHLQGGCRPAFVGRGGHERRLAGPDQAVWVCAAGENVAELRARQSTAQHGTARHSMGQHNQRGTWFTGEEGGEG